MKVGILGATGAVGQQFVRLLQDHPFFTITAVAASERSAGKSYREAAHWFGSDPIPEAVAHLTVQPCVPTLDCDLVFSGLDASVAGEVEAEFAKAGYPVVSNAKNYRMDPSVPLLIPEVNPEHTGLVKGQQWGKENGFVVTNPNCSTVGLVCALRPLVDAFGVETVQVVTMQAVSGAGYPGVSSLDIMGNVVPHIGGEEIKMESETKKLLGTYAEGAVTPAEMTISAQCNRVPVLNGHLECVSLKLASKASVGDVKAALREFDNPLASLRIDGQPLPTFVDPFVQVYDEEDAPQPRRHVSRGRGMQVGVGRVRSCPVLDVKFVVLSHNTVRGAAGGAILNAELLLAQGLLEPALA